MTKNFNLFAHFAPNFEKYADKELLLTLDDQSFSYSDIDQSSSRLARFLDELGIQIGDRVSVQVKKSPAAFALYLACLRGGFVFHPLNTDYKTSELDYFFSDAKPSIIICDDRHFNEVSELAATSNTKHVMTLNADNTGSLIENSKDVSSDPILVHRDNNDLAALLYSSGTTGVPKGIMLSHGNLLSNTEALVKTWGFSSDDRLLHSLPIFHVHGLFVALGCVLLSGANMIWLDSYNSSDVIKNLPNCTVMMGVPTFYTRLLSDESFTKGVCSQVRLFISGSAPLLMETFQEFESRTGHCIVERYGMTETNMNTSNPLDGIRKPGTVGLPLPGVEIRIIDEQGVLLESNQIGDLQVRGPNVFLGYWQMPDKTSEDFTDDGFFNTGDKGMIDEDGYVSIVGRAKDLVITGGLNVYPKEVELVIDGIAGVKESAIIGVPHADFGEAVVAIIVRDPSEGEICDRLNADSVIQISKELLANFKVPKSIQFVDELPRNTMAKVQKNLLRDKYRTLFSIS